MGTDLDVIEFAYKSAAVPKCCEHGCKIDLAGLSRSLILKGESLVGDGEPICDCIIFDTEKGLTASLIEIKSSSMNANKIKKQFEGGGRKALEIMDGLGRAEPRMIVALVAKKYSRWVQHRNLVRARVSIGQKKYPIILCKCNVRLTDMRCPATRDKRNNRVAGRK